MKLWLQKAKDWLVFVFSLEINILLTLLLFNVDIWQNLWNIGRINIAIGLFYGWLWFIEYYLSRTQK